MVLSIQSHVAFGRVGNRSAVFPLELIGQEVVVINTVQFSNHTGYGEWTGDIFSARHIKNILQGIEKRGGMICDAVLSGYMGTPEIGEIIIEAVDRVRACRQDAVYCLDPVMGDYGRGFFVHKEIPEFIKNEAVKKATIITPNQFEAEYLAEMKINEISHAQEACRRIRSQGPQIVLITSFQKDNDDKIISMYLSDRGEDWIITTERLKFNADPNGAGDLTAALFLGRFLQSRNASDALGKMANSVYAVFEKTYNAKSRELCLVDSRFDIMEPAVRFEVLPV
ncbi:MAG TPA: pyridoxal kinase PdxY [Chitinispirillaceae bacterium]|nr:pyridoxal kinase PdxY [Chitinispirillaceae bacterium]